MANIANPSLARKFLPQDTTTESIIDKFFQNSKSKQFKSGSFEENSAALSITSLLGQTKKFQDEEGYSAFYDPQLKPYINSIDFFKSSGSSLESKYLINELHEKSSMINENPAAYFLGRLVGGILDPVTYAAFSMKAFRTASGAYNIKKIGAITAAEELYKQSIDSRRDSDLGWQVPLGSMIVVGLLNRIPKLQSFEGGEAIGKYNKQMNLLDMREAEIARRKLLKDDAIDDAQYKDIDIIDSRILNPKEKIGPQSGGAQAKGESRSYNDDLYDEAIANTFTGLEKTNLTPFFRLTKSRLLTSRELATDIFDSKLIQNKNTKGIATTESIEFNIATKFRYVDQVIQEGKKGYKDYLKQVYQENNLGKPGIFKDPLNKFKGVKYLSKNEFQNRVTLQLLRKEGEDAIPQVNKVARYIRQNFFDRIGREADEQEMFSLYSKVAISTLKKAKDRMVKEQKTSTVEKGKTYTLDEINKKINAEEARLKTINETGPLRSNFLPRYWRRDVMRNLPPKTAKDILNQALKNEGTILTAKQLDEFYDDILTSTPFNKIPKDAVKDGTFDLDVVFQPSGVSKHLRNRVWKFDDAYLMEKGFLEKNINLITKQYFNSMIPDIEIAKVFGDVSMMGLRGPGQGFRPSIPEVRGEWMAYINKVAPVKTKPNSRKKLIKEMNNDIRDLEAARDLQRGTYGLPEGPETAIPAGIRTYKNISNMIFLTGFLSAAPDMARLIMQNGFKKGFGQTFEVFANKANREILKMSKKEAAIVGEALDLTVAGRANTIGNIDDMVFGLNSIERMSSSANSFYFTFINLMNVWNTGMKTASSYIGSTKIIEWAEQSAKGTISKGNKRKLAAGGIDANSAKRIWEQYQKFGLGAKGIERGDLKYSRVARSDLWDDRAAASAFGNALRKDIRTTIITPDKADVPLWMNTQLGGVISQFKKFGMAATQGIMMRGLQDRDQNFFIGLGFLIGMGALVDSVRQRAFDRDYEKKPLGDKISSAIDRSGAIGIFSDLNRMVEVMSDNDLGIAPALGAGKPYSATNRQKVGLAGPAGSLGYNLYEIMLDTGSGNYDYTTARAIRRSLPLQNIWYLDGIFDRFEKGIR